MKLRWVEREVIMPVKSPLDENTFTITGMSTKEKVLQYWEQTYYSCDDGKWVDVPLEVEEV